jgi:hypothetical protein
MEYDHKPPSWQRSNLNRTCQQHGGRPLPPQTDSLAKAYTSPRSIGFRSHQDQRLL